ncbi:MAG: hypothetical protein ACI399_07670 [Candidatus Cryptobacteroides sp.]
MTTMKTFELIVTKENADEKGFATIPSMLTQIVDTMEGSRNDRMVVRNSVLELFERPKVDEVYNLSVVRSEVTEQGGEETAVVTDQDGHEIGNCKAELSPLKHKEGMKRPDSSKYISKFFRLLPEEVQNTGLSVKLEFECREEPEVLGDISYRLMTPRSDTFLFSAGSQNRIFCSASLTTE